MRTFPCPYLGGEVQLTSEREAHIARNHPDLLPEHGERIGDTLAAPDMVRRSARVATARLLSRWFEEVRGGKHVVVVVMTDEEGTRRHWVVTAYIARKLAEGNVEWRRS